MKNEDTYYFTGKECIHGHIEKRRTKDGACLQCSSDRGKSEKYKLNKKKYRQDNKEKFKARDKIYAENNSEKLKEKRKKYYIKNRLKILARQKKQRETIGITEEKREWYRNYARKNTKKIKENNDKFRRNNKAKLNSWAAERRAKKQNRIPKWITSDDRKIMRAIYILCRMKSKLLGVVYNIDHVIPLCGAMVSGLHVPNNFQIILAEDNFKKGNKFN